VNLKWDFDIFGLSDVKWFFLLPYGQEFSGQVLPDLCLADRRSLTLSLSLATTA